MTPPRPKTDGDLRTPSNDVDSVEEAPGVPGFATWRGVYVFVFVTFVVTVAALALFSRVYA